MGGCFRRQTPANPAHALANVTANVRFPHTNEATVPSTRRQAKPLVDLPETANIQGQETSESLMKSAIDAMAVHVAILDPSGTILAVNEAWRAFGAANGYDHPDHGVGTNYVQVCDLAIANGDASANKARTAILDLLAGRMQGATFEYPCHSPDTARWFIFRGARFMNAGETHVVITHDDITLRHLAEDALRSSHDALEAFNLVISHDIRAPLRRIEELSRLAIESERDAPSSSAELLARIQSEARRARTLANELLDLSRVSDSSTIRETLDISKLARDTMEPLLAVDPQRRAKVTIQPGMRAMGDPRLVKMILTNLLTNCWKFTQSKDVASIEVTSMRDASGRLSFSVRDNGIGFSDADAVHLFQPFTRLAAANDYEGSGVGLAIVRRAVERHGGHVWATGTPGVGATVRFTLGAE